VVVSTLYALYNGTGDNGSTYAIGAATYSGGSWAQFGSNPVLQLGSGWESNGVKDPRLVWDGSQYVMFYSGYNATPTFKIGRATASAHTGSWTKYGSNPVITTGGGGSPDQNGAAAPVVLYSPGTFAHDWWMWYVGTDGSNVGSTCLAHSDDGITWTKAGQILTGVGAGAVYLNGTTINLFVNTSTNTVALYTASSPTGSYTLVGTLVHARSVDGSTSPNINADVTAGATSITIVSGQGANLQIGEAVIIADTNSGPEVKYVSSVASTTIGLTTGTDHSYQVADGAVLRSLGYTWRDARSVLLTSGGGYQMFGTAFRALDGLSTPSPTVWEGSLRYTASALVGPWTQDYAAGVLFPLLNNGTWEATSAENPSVIVAP
jgi:hypothetical protein